jgi:hypothetical protein
LSVDETIGMSYFALVFYRLIYTSNANNSVVDKLGSVLLCDTIHASPVCKPIVHKNDSCSTQELVRVLVDFYQPIMCHSIE